MSLFIKNTQAIDVLGGDFPWVMYQWWHGMLRRSSLWPRVEAATGQGVMLPCSLHPCVGFGQGLQHAAMGEHVCLVLGLTAVLSRRRERHGQNVKWEWTAWVRQSRAFSRAQESSKKLWIITYVNIDLHVYLKNAFLIFSWLDGELFECYSLNIFSPVGEKWSTGRLTDFLGMIK